MDIDLLSKMVKELILDNDEVTLYGVGTFVAEIVPSSFSDKGYTINPPYRKLSFRQRESDDKLLRDFYIRTNNVDELSAEKILEDFFAEMKEVLKQKKIIIFPGLGRLRATRENNFFFVADEDLDIYPQGYGLGPISLKTHQETPEQVNSAIASLKSILDMPEEEPASEPVAELEVLPELEIEPVIEIEIDDQPDSPDHSTDTIEEPVLENSPIDASPSEVVGNEEEPIVEDVVADSPEAVVVEPVVAQVAEPVVEEPEPVSEEAPSGENVEVEQNSTETVVAAEPAEEEPEVSLPASEQVENPSEPETPAVQSSVETSSVEKPAPSKGMSVLKTVIAVILILVAVCTVALLLFVLLAHVAPDFVDSLLYTPEELKIINY